MDERQQKGLSPRQRKSIVIRVVLLLLCVLILYGEYTLQKAEEKRKEPTENTQDGALAEEMYEKEKLAIVNEYQTKFQDAVNTYEIRDGKLYGSGANSCGQLGTGEITSWDYYEQQVLIAENVIHMDACGETLVYLNDKNELYGVGNNGSGQLGQPIDEKDGRTYITYDAYNRCCITEPVFIMDNVKYASVGGGYIMVLQEDGTLYTMGANLNGQLGNGTARPVVNEWYAKEGTVYSSEPVYVMDDIAFIAADDYTAAAISKKGDLWVWGDNSFGEIGNSRRGNGMPSVSTDVVSKPYLVLKKIKEVYFEDYTVYAVNFQNQEYCWGKNATTSPKPVKPNVSVDITELYHTHVGDAGNLYFIDENNVLWGSGRNEYGQLGQGTQDYDFHDEAVKIAENVIDVDYSQKGFIIYLTKDNKLYGLGNAGCGALQQYQTFDGSKYVNDEHYCITEPYLLMEDVKYARCGRADVACLAQDGTVWVWGTVWCSGSWLGPQGSYSVSYIEKPHRILDDAVLVTGGWNNHAALLRDGTVWTWGYNISGNCGVEAPELISEPIKVAEDVDMVWTDRALPNYPEPTAEDITKALKGELTYHTEYEDITGFDGIYPRLLNNTVIRKADGSYQACGENIGTEEKIVHGAEADYPVICTYEFVQCE